MIKRILNFFRLDTVLSLRDSVLVYSLVSPLILAVIVRLLVPSVQASTFTMALQSDLPSAVIQTLAGFGEIELHDNLESIQARVAENDDVPGLSVQNGTYVLLLEGNEDAAASEGFASLVAAATATGDGPVVAVTDLQGTPPPILEYAAVMLVLLSLFVGGILVGFNIVDEKESKVMNAMAVTPLRMIEYVAARSILAVLIALLSGFGTALIVLGGQIPVVTLIGAILAGLFVALPFGFIIGALADNQMTAFAMVKLLMAVFLTIPFVTIFIPDHLQWLFFIFPNYWMFTAVSNAIVGIGVVGYGWSLVLSVGTGLLMVAALFPRLKRGLSLR